MSGKANGNGNGKKHGNGKGKHAGLTGRPRAWDPSAEDVQTVDKMAGVLTAGQLAAFFGVSEDTFNRRLRDTPELLRAYQKGRARMIGVAGSTLVRLAVGSNAILDAQGRVLMPAQPPNITALIFYLKTQAKWSERIPTDGMSDELRALLSMATDDLERFEEMGDEEIIELLRARGHGAPSAS